MAEDVEALVKKEIAEARRILRDDKVLAKLNKHFPDEEPDDDKPKPPPKKDNPETKEPAKRPGIWWGAAANDD
jgi:hypothetical protein